MNDPIATTRLRYRSADGIEREVRIEIGRPYAVGDSEAACAVALTGLHDEVPDICGKDTFQALCLALALVRRLLENATAGDGKLLWPDDDTEIDPASVWDLHGPRG